MRQLTKAILIFSMMNLFMFLVSIPFSMDRRVVLFFVNHGLIVSDEEVQDRLNTVINQASIENIATDRLSASLYSRQLFEIAYNVSSDYTITDAILQGQRIEASLSNLYVEIANNIIETFESQTADSLSIIEAQSNLVNFDPRLDTSYRSALRRYAQFKLDLDVVNASNEDRVVLLKFIHAKLITPKLPLEWLMMSLITALIAFTMHLYAKRRL